MSKAARQAITAPSVGGNGQEHPFLRAYDAVHEAERLRLAGKLDRAESACAALLKEYPDYVAALRTMGLVLADRAQYERALKYLHRASMLYPDDHKILTALSGVYLRLESPSMAARTLEEARRLAPNDVNILATLGEIYREEREYELSKQAFAAALKLDPSFTVAELGLALNLAQIGQLAEVAEIVERRVREGARSVNLLYMLSQLPPSLVSIDLVSLLDEAAPDGNKGRNDEFLAGLAFTKAAALDKVGDYDGAWTQLGEARRYNYLDNRKHYVKFRQRFDPLLDLTRNAPSALKSAAAGSAEYPISLFIAGPSRSGKTSLERLVGSLPGVKKGYENPIVENAVRRAFQAAGLPTRSSLVELPPPLSDLFQKSYIEELGKRAQTAKVFTNTLPARIDDALRAAAEIPNSRFIFLKRDIDDISLRIYMRNYKAGNYYASDLRDIREYVTWCHRMTDVMVKKMPGISLVLSYEEIVADPAAALAKAAELCGLEVSGDRLHSMGDDRGCAAPYRDRIETALRAPD